MRRILLIMAGACIPMTLWQQGVSIGTSGAPPHQSAALDVNSQTGGMLFPRMTTAQRNSIVSPAEGLFIFNTDTRCFEFYNNLSASWQQMYCACEYPAPPVLQSATSNTYQGFTANWQASPGATGYFIDVAFDTSFSHMVPGYMDYFAGSGTSVTVNGLLCDTTYYYRVRPFVSCGAGFSAGKMAAATGTCTACIRMGTSYYELIYGIASYSDGSYVLGFYAENVVNGYYGFQIVKLSSTHQVLWVKNVGSTTGDSYLYDVAATSDGGVIAIGQSYNTYQSSYYRFMASRLDASGNVLWVKGYGVSGSYHSNGYSVIQTQDGGFVFSGRTNGAGAGGYDMYAIKVDGNGNLLWTRVYGTSSADYSYSVAEASDGSIYVAGYTSYGGLGSNDCFVVKLNSSGAVQWNRVLGGGSTDVCFNVITDSNGDVYLSGYSNSFAGGYEGLYVVKLNSAGTVLWGKTYYKTGYSIYQNSVGRSIAFYNGTLYVAGFADLGTGSSNDMVVLKINPSDGSLLKSVIIGTTGSEVANGISIPPNGGKIFVAGYTNFSTYGSDDGYVAMLDMDLQGCCSTTVTLSEASGYSQTSTGSTTTSGTTYSGGTSISGVINSTILCQ